VTAKDHRWLAMDNTHDVARGKAGGEGLGRVGGSGHRALFCADSAGPGLNKKRSRASAERLHGVQQM
jgi:hypothetical protein